MKNKLTVILLIFMIPIMSCKKKEVDYVKGELIFSIYDFISFERTYSLVDSLNLKINYIYDYTYESVTSEDSIEILETVLSTKVYLTSQGRSYTVTQIDSITKINVNFFDFDNNDAIDWFSTVVSFSLFENVTESSNKWGILKVPEGEEQFWVDELKKYEIVQFASLNHNNIVLRN